MKPKFWERLAAFIDRLAIASDKLTEFLMPLLLILLLILFIVSLWRQP